MSTTHKQDSVKHARRAPEETTYVADTPMITTEPSDRTVVTKIQLSLMSA